MMQHKKEDSLVIYKASAGSGKTFTLAVNYIKLLILSPQNYRNILAVTFTNKATEEMKLRVLSQLYGIWKLLPDSKGYLNKVTTELGLSEDYVSRQAGVALSNLLHNYNYFQVETIDAFFQSVLRNLARELELTANLHVGLNDYQVEQQAVDELIESLKPTSKVLKWILSYIQQNISDDKSWNVIGQIKKFGENIFKDVYKSNYRSIHELLSNEQAYENYVKTIRGIRVESEKSLQRIADGFYRLLEDNGLEVKDFSNGSRGVCSYFEKLAKGKYDEEDVLTKTVKQGMEDPKIWVRKNEQIEGNRKFDVVRNYLLPYIIDAEKEREHLVVSLKSAKLTLRHLDQLRLLSNIEDKVREINASSNRFLLSDTQMLLHSLIQGSDSPFIFEKIGTQLEHIMIDEFQDTSTTQWHNFKVLLQECLSRPNSRNLIVGDVKQSIYRWRSGDWRLLNNIEDQFDSSLYRFSVQSKKDNFRSERNIVTFNNSFFSFASQFEYQEFSKINQENAKQIFMAYQDVVQSVPEDKPCRGMVEIDLLPNADYKERMLEKIGETIDILLQHGATPQSIAILVRSNKTIAEIADYLTQTRPAISIISDEAFKLDSSLAVHIIINALTVMLNPTDKLTIAILAKAYQKHILKNDVPDERMLLRKQDLTSYLPREFWERRGSLLSMPVYNLVEFIYQVFRLEVLNEQNAYICTFYDLLNNFLMEKSADIQDVIHEWEENMKDKTIQSDEFNGVRLITIHKSKGLEFEHVIIPFCDWQLEKTGHILWCSPTEAPFNQLSLIPIDFSPKQMKGSVFEADYLHEHLQNVVDNLNLLYVAFTRASKNLFVFGKQGNANSRSFVIAQVIEQVHEALPDSSYIEGSESETGDISFTYGELYIPPTDKKQFADTQNVFNKQPSPIELKVEVFPGKVDFLQSNRSKEFLADDEDDDKIKGYINIGNILHQVFAKIHTVDDIDKVLKELEFNGILYDEQITYEGLVKLLHSRFDDPRVARWFSPKWRLFNECTILMIDPDTDCTIEQRPDRVIMDDNEVIVIDFKFGNPREEYHRQVLRYMSLLSAMGYDNVKGYLWFVYSNNIVEIR